ncbi:PaaI family thioesterase [Thermus sp.]|uniref:PaaI family thioesterase n=1 Tax=Thermus sp. TaxID=275 RepID=UPI0025FEDD90|nr:PaaI family thioesterase [Thermus sp.]MCS6868503.1 PaaI family thioesterase [Thermus sp.]MDW8358867.1 PaaI family thioesterase [Thermus sp.]
MAKNPFLAREGLVWGEGKVELCLALQEEFLQAQGRVHGGALASVLDTLMGPAAGSLGVQVATGPRLHARAEVVRAGESLAAVEGTVLDERGQRVARGKGRFSRVG